MRVLLGKKEIQQKNTFKAEEDDSISAGAPQKSMKVHLAYRVFADEQDASAKIA